jgi:flagellar biosynthetic protein FlhB
MAEEGGADRTEDATPRKKQQARERGQVPRSRDLSAAIVVFSAAVFLRYGGGWLAREVLILSGSVLENIGSEPMPAGVQALYLAPRWVAHVALALLPMLLLLFVIAYASGAIQFGFLFASESLRLNFEKLNPVAGLKRMFNLKSLMTFVMNLLKVAIVAVVAIVYVRSELFAVRALSEAGVASSVVRIVDSVLDLMLLLAAILLVLGVLDYWYQRFQWERDLRMTKQEVKEEMRDTEGDPHVRARRRQIQRQMAQQRMMAEVPQADVVVRNPTHYAVALRYEPQKDASPRVVAKGINRMALRIIDVAVKNGVPTKVDPPLARKLYRLEIGDPVPTELYQAVAEVLAWVVNQGKSRHLADHVSAA